MRKLIYRFCQKLHNHHLIPWFLWSPVYDHFHSLFEEGKQWDRSRKPKDKLKRQL